MRWAWTIAGGLTVAMGVATACGGDDEPAGAQPLGEPDGGGPVGTAPGPSPGPPPGGNPDASPPSGPPPEILAQGLDHPAMVVEALGIVYVTVTGENRLVRIEPDAGPEAGAPTTVKGTTTAPWGLAAGPFGMNGFIGIGEVGDAGTSRVQTVICSKTSCSNLAAMTTTEGVVRHVDRDGTRDFYWAVEDQGVIRHKDPLAGGISVLVAGEPGVYGINTRQFQTVFTRREPAGRLRSINTADGGDLKDLATNLTSPEGVSRNQTHIFVADTGGDRIAVCPATGCGGQAATFAPARHPHEVVAYANRVIWTNGTSPDGSVEWCPADGCPPEGPQTLASNLDNPRGITSSLTHVYWVNDNAQGSVMRVPVP